MCVTRSGPLPRGVAATLAEDSCEATGVHVELQRVRVTNARYGGVSLVSLSESSVSMQEVTVHECAAKGIFLDIRRECQVLGARCVAERGFVEPGGAMSAGCRLSTACAGALERRPSGPVGFLLWVVSSSVLTFSADVAASPAREHARRGGLM